VVRWFGRFNEEQRRLDQPSSVARVIRSASQCVVVVVKRLRILLAIAICALGLTASGAALAVIESPPPEQDGTADGVYSISLADGAITLEDEQVDGGRVQVDVSNTGTQEHELVVVRTELAPDALPVGLHGVSIAGAGKLVIGEDHQKLGHDHASDVVLGLRPGETNTYELDLEPGHYVAFCQTSNHYLAAEESAEFMVTG
jgi:hypothetical protein